MTLYSCGTYQNELQSAFHKTEENKSEQQVFVRFGVSDMDMIVCQLETSFYV